LGILKQQSDEERESSLWLFSKEQQQKDNSKLVSAIADNKKMPMSLIFFLTVIKIFISLYLL
jgi:hypothetical protein